MNVPPCQHLRTKRLFIPDLATDAFARNDDLYEVHQCWCNKTMMERGLDERQVSVSACTDSSRSCYRHAGTPF